MLPYQQHSEQFSPNVCKKTAAAYAAQKAHCVVPVWRNLFVLFGVLDPVTCIVALETSGEGQGLGVTLASVFYLETTAQYAWSRPVRLEPPPCATSCFLSFLSLCQESCRQPISSSGTHSCSEEA
jgi:hypothetical protein